jgi:chromosome segregation ATPase
MTTRLTFQQIDSNSVCLIGSLKQCEVVRDRLSACAEKICSLEEEMDRIEREGSFFSQKIIRLHEEIGKVDQKILDVCRDTALGKMSNGVSGIEVALEQVEAEQKSMDLKLKQLQTEWTAVYREQNKVEEEILELEIFLSETR